MVGEFIPEKLSSVHSFSVTEDYAVFFFYPAVIDAKVYIIEGGTDTHVGVKSNLTFYIIILNGVM